ncbi:MAG: hypothetical protein VX700_12935 [Pseudomonadota bacterium]|nr:hypothetical protein [Pseudomonadota bacterium]
MKIAIAGFEAGAAAYVRPLMARWEESDEIQFQSFFAPPDSRYDPPTKAFLRWLSESDVLLLSATGNERETELRAFAGDAGIPCAQIVDTWYNYLARFDENAVPPAEIVWPDLIFVVDDAARAEAIEASLPSDRLAVAGQPAWEDVPSLPKGEDGTILFIDQTLRRSSKIAHKYNEMDTFRILQRLVSIGDNGWQRLLVCPHPKREDPSIFATELVRPQEGLRRARVVVGMYSSLMVEGLLGGKWVVSLQPGELMGNRDILSRRGLIPLVDDYESLVEVLASPPTPSSNDEFMKLFEGSAARVESALRRLAAQHAALIA